MIKCVEAIEYVRPMCGKSRPHLLRCSDGGQYVVKFQTNVHGGRVLANELLGSTLATHMLLPVPEFSIVCVGDEMVRCCEKEAKLVGAAELSNDPCPTRLCFGSRLPSCDNALVADEPFDTPDSGGYSFSRVENARDFLGMLVFDQWACNRDTRQAIYVRTNHNSQLRVYMIDEGCCFGNTWRFQDSPYLGLYRSPRTYSAVQGIGSFEPWLAIVETAITHATLEAAAMQIPSQWYQDEFASLSRLVDTLYRRRKKVRGLLLATLAARPKWFGAARANRSNRPVGASLVNRRASSIYREFRIETSAPK